MKKRITALFLSLATLFVAAPFSGIAAAENAWNTNLEELTSTTNKPAKLTYTADGLTVTRTTENDGLAISKTKTDGNFMLESDVTITGGNVANLIFGAASNRTAENSFIFKLDRSNRGETKIFCFSGSKGYPTISSNSPNAFSMNQDRYHLKVVVLNGTCAAYVDDILVCSASLPDYYTDGYLGIGAAEGSTVVFQNTTYTDLGQKQLAKITDIQVEGHIVTPSYTEDVAAYGVLAVPNDTESVKVTVTLSDGDGKLTVNGKEAVSGVATEVALAVGKNIIPILLTDNATGIGIPVTLSVTRKSTEEEYRIEDYRDQYHFSPMEGWLNDPNGLIYYNDQWHLFYQYIPLTTAHSDADKHWGHAVSDDLIHWEDLPVALYPDEELGSIWSGSTVPDPENKSGLFAGKDKNNLLAFFTHRADNGKQVQSLAYSSDGGVTWTKYADNPILDASDDPLNDGNFRDPNVFWCDEFNTYLMVVAGGPLRLYSSDDLLNWTFESGYDNNHPQYRPNGVSAINSECPDLFPIAVEGEADTIKWIYTGAGDWYMIGDLKEVNGRISFVPDSNTRYPLEFGHDAYAGVTFKNGPDGRVVMVSWMANWGYAGAMPTNPWNGTFTLFYELTLKNTSKGLRLFQNPVKEYETLREEPLLDVTDAVIRENGENLLRDIRGDQLELIAHLEPGQGVSEVGFKLFQGNNYEMIVKYNPRTAQLTMDRGNVSDIKPGSYASSPISNYTLTKNADGSVDLRIFLDWNSVEVIANNGEIYGSQLVFPDYASIGMEVYSKGGDTVADITVYPLDTIWRSKESTEVKAVYLDIRDRTVLSLGEEFTIHARVKDRMAEQSVTWALDDPSQAVEIVAQNDTAITLKVVSQGNFSVTARTKDGEEEVSAHLTSNEEGFNTNLTDWSNTGNGSWSVVTDGYQGVTGADGFSVGSEIFEDNFKLELDVTMLSGTAFGIVFHASDNPGGGCYMVNFDLNDSTFGQRFRWTEFPYRGDGSNNAQTMFSDSVTPELGKTYHIELTYLNGELTYVFDGVTIFEREIDSDPSQSFTSGHIGVMGYNSTFVVNNVYVYTEVGLEDLTLSQGTLSPAFDSAVAEYRAKVPNDIDSITLTPAFPLGAEVTINGQKAESGQASAPIALAVGENTLTVTLKNLDGETTYTVKVTREDASTPPVETSATDAPVQTPTSTDLPSDPVQPGDPAQPDDPASPLVPILATLAALLTLGAAAAAVILVHKKKKK